MKSLLLVAALVFAPVVMFAADIASVNFKALKPDLRSYYLAKPENAQLKARYEAASAGEHERMEQIQAAMAEGKGKVDVLKMMPKSGDQSPYALERKIDAELRKELYLSVSSLGLKYELIYDGSDSDSVIYAKSQVDDVTTLVKQALIDRAQKE